MALIFDPFSASIFGCLFGRPFSNFARKWAPKGVQNGVREEPGNLQKRSQNAPKSDPRPNLNLSTILCRFGSPFWLKFVSFGGIFCECSCCFAVSPLPKYLTTNPDSPVSPGVRRSTLCVHNDFRPPILARFFDFFRKWQKCEISEEYNAKRGFEPLKSFDFRIDFSLFFHIFSGTPPGPHFFRFFPT